MDKFTNWENIPVVLNTRQVAEVLNVHINTVKNLVARKELKSFKIGKALRIRKEDLQAFIEQAEVKA